MTDNNRKRRPGDWWLAGGVLAAALLLAAGLWLWSGTGAAVEVTVAGERVLTLPLHTDTTVTIPGADGGENVLVIEGGTARVESATCPDGICVAHRAISRPGQSILCLPNQVAVTVVGGAAAVDGEV